MPVIGHVSAFDLKDEVVETALSDINASVSALDTKLDTLATAAALTDVSASIDTLDTTLNTVAADVVTIKGNTTPAG